MSLLRTLLASFLLCTAAVAAAAGEVPILKAGIITDTHVTPKPSSCEWVQKAWELFKAKNVDLVVNCGDIADLHYPQGYRNYRDVINKVFPDKSKKPREIYVYANHDRIRVEDMNKAFADVQKYLEAPNGQYAEFDLKGYPFVVVPQTVDFERYEKMIQNAIKKFPGKPVFVIDHNPPFLTVYNSSTWGNAQRRELLNKYPQVVHISGHSHNTLFNELSIWQGEFTAVNAGALYYWGGALPASPSGIRKRATEAMIMEVYKDKILFRRYCLWENTEYKPAFPWCIPLPFNPKTAPYRKEKRFADSAAPRFAVGAKLSMAPDAVPFNHVNLTIPHAAPDVFTYAITFEKQSATGKFEHFAYREVFSNFYLPAAERNAEVQAALPAAYFDTNSVYRINVTPVNFFGKKGKSLSMIWRAPAKVQNKVLFESKNPMKELSFMSELKDGVPMKQKDGFYIHDVFNARLLFPDKVWAGIPAGTRLRLTADIHTIQGHEKMWTLTIRNPAPQRNASGRVTTGPGNFKSRYVFNFRMQKANWKYYLLIREAYTGKIRFNYFKLEQLPDEPQVKK